MILDLTDYWRHRLSHVFDWWYCAARRCITRSGQMTFWSDDRNHLLDEVVSFVWFMAVGPADRHLAAAVPARWCCCCRLLESLSHANTRVSFGWLGERLLVSPRFHRAHHGIAAAGTRSVNYGAILPWWDMLFRTADFSRAFVRTGDPTAAEVFATGGYVAQQWAGISRLVRSLPPRRDRARRSRTDGARRAKA